MLPKQDVERTVRVPFSRDANVSSAVLAATTKVALAMKRHESMAQMICEALCFALSWWL